MDLEEAEDAPERLSALSANARKLAQLLGLEAGATSELLLWRVCPHLDASQQRDALAELTKARVVVAAEGAYRLASARNARARRRHPGSGGA